MGFFYWQNQTSPVNLNQKKEFTFVVADGESISGIAERLKKQKLIKNSFLFKILVKIKKLDQKIQAGSFLLSPSLDNLSLARKLTIGSFDVWITIPEGLRKEEVAEKINAKLPIDKNEFIKNAKEGYLFPDTYLIPKNYSAIDIIKLMENNFSQKVPSLKDQETLILASIVEREAMVAKDRPIVAGILLKRFQNGWPIEADATTQYALGFSSEEKTWWKKNLTLDDLKIDSPYNTRKNLGFPPMPICSPGLAAINASFAPLKTSYWYYLSDKDGLMHYAVTLDEHNNNINKYLR